MSNLTDFIGKKYSRLTVISVAPKSHLICLCVCGKTKQILAFRVLKGITKSCGCLNREVLRQHNVKHGNTETKEYRAWSHIRGRCNNPTDSAFNRYGGRGIKVCERWNSFANFLSDMGRAPTPKHSVDRKNNNGNYEPSNCYWATSKEQSNNRRSNIKVTLYGKTQTLKQWCEELFMPYSAIQRRLAYGWDHERALTQPVKILKARSSRPYIDRKEYTLISV